LTASIIDGTDTPLDGGLSMSVSELDELVYALIIYHSLSLSLQTLNSPLSTILSFIVT